MKRSVWLAWAVLCLVCAAFTGAAAAPDATAFVRQVGNEMPGVLAGTHTIEERRARLMPFIEHVVDVPAVAAYCLGHYWKLATAAQQQQLQSLFLSVVVNTIATWTDDHKGFGMKANVVMQAPIPRADGTYVPTLVQAGDAPVVNITWVVDMQDQPARILDVMADGISVRRMERSDFVGYLNHTGGDIDGLIGVLRKRALAMGGLTDSAAPATLKNALP